MLWGFQWNGNVWVFGLCKYVWIFFFFGFIVFTHFFCCFFIEPKEKRLMNCISVTFDSSSWFRSIDSNRFSVGGNEKWWWRYEIDFLVIDYFLVKVELNTWIRHVFKPAACDLKPLTVKNVLCTHNHNHKHKLLCNNKNITFFV